MKSYILPGERREDSHKTNRPGGFWHVNGKPCRGWTSGELRSALRKGLRVDDHVLEDMEREWEAWRSSMPEKPGPVRYDDKFSVYDEGSHYRVMFSKSVLTPRLEPGFLRKYGRGFAVYRDEVSPSGPMVRIYTQGNANR